MHAFVAALAAPGLALHELAHAAAAAPVADVDIDWQGRPEVIIAWTTSPSLLRLSLVFLAPVALGGFLLLGGALTIEWLAALPWPVQIWLAIQWVVLAGPSLVDLRELHRSVGSLP